MKKYVGTKKKITTMDDHVEFPVSFSWYVIQGPEIIEGYNAVFLTID